MGHFAERIATGGKEVCQRETAHAEEISHRVVACEETEDTVVQKSLKIAENKSPCASSSYSPTQGT